MESKFDFIPAMDRDNQSKRDELSRRVADNEPCAIAYARLYPAALSAVITRFADFGKTITVEQCKALVADLAAASGSDDIYSIKVSIGAEKTAVYFVAQNCLRIFAGDRPIYENDNGRICRDGGALSDCNTSRMWY